MVSCSQSIGSCPHRRCQAMSFHSSLVTGWPTKNASVTHSPSLSGMAHSGKCNTCVYASCTGSALALNLPICLLSLPILCNQGLRLLSSRTFCSCNSSRGCASGVHGTFLSTLKDLVLCNSCPGLHKCGACVSVQQCNDIVEAMPESGESTCPSDTRWADLVSEEPVHLLLSQGVH